MQVRKQQLELDMKQQTGSKYAWRILGTEEPGGLPFMGPTDSDTTDMT